MGRSKARHRAPARPYTEHPTCGSSFRSSRRAGRGSGYNRAAMMIATLAAALLMTSSGTKPDQYSERWLCDLWAGAQCHATSCSKDAKERCLASSKQCKDTSRKVTQKVEFRLMDNPAALALLLGLLGAEWIIRRKNNFK